MPGLQDVTDLPGVTLTLPPLEAIHCSWLLREEWGRMIPPPSSELERRLALSPAHLLQTITVL